MFRSIKKGSYGYLKAKRNQVILMTFVYFAVSLSLFIAGIVTTGSKKNLLTIVAVLGMLPAARSLVSAILYIRARGCSSALYTKLSALSLWQLGMYDLYFTSYQKNFAISHMILFEKTVIGLTEDPKCDCSLCEKHLESQLKEGGIKDITIKIFTDSKKYMDRLNQINQLEHHSTKLEAEIQSILYQISL